MQVNTFNYRNPLRIYPQMELVAKSGIETYHEKRQDFERKVEKTRNPTLAEKSSKPPKTQKTPKNPKKRGFLYLIDPPHLGGFGGKFGCTKKGGYIYD
jgi:hypothetical protein